MTRLLLVLALLTTHLRAEGLLGLDWRYRHGDDPAWREPAFNATDWPTMNLGVSWERQGVHNGDTAILLQHVTVPAEQARRGLVVRLRLHADRTDLFVNGHPILTAAAADQLAEAPIAADILRPDGENVFALRVTNHQWTGGEALDFADLRPADSTAVDPSIEVEYAPADHVIPAETEIALPLRLRGSVPGRLTATVVSDLHERISIWEAPAATESGSGNPVLRLGRLAPGFYQVVARFTTPTIHVQQVSWFAVAPERIVGTFPLAPGVTEYWQRAKRELAAVAPEFRLVEEPARSTPHHRVYTAEMKSIGGVTLRAWFVVPTSPGPHPATLHLPGYSSAMQVEWFLGDSDMIHLALDIRGHGRSADVFNPGFGAPGFVGDRVRDPESYVYRNAFMDCGRALEFLATRPEVDQSRIAVDGMSQGGGLALATAALFPEHVARCAAGVPFLGAFEDHIRVRTVYREEMAYHLKLAGGTDWTEVERTMHLIDLQNLAPAIRCPVMMTVGLFDDDCPPRIGFAVYNRLTVPKTFHIRPNSPHMLDGQWGRISSEWIRQEFGLPEKSSDR